MNHPNTNSSRRVQSTADPNSLDVNRVSAWYEDLEEYERNLEEMSNASLDQTFQEEMQHVNQWFSYLTDAEKTSTIYTLLQHSSQVQIKFFIHLLQEMKRPKLNSLNRASERASTLMNLNIRQGTNPPPAVSQGGANNTNRHSFALGDTQQLSRLFGNMGNGWFSQEEQPSKPSPIPNPPNTVQHNALRPKSVVDLNNNLNPSFSSSWLHQRPPGLFGDSQNNVIKRPKSADVSSWASLPGKQESWQPLNNQHDLDFQHQWKDPISYTKRLSPIAYDRRLSFNPLRHQSSSLQHSSLDDGFSKYGHETSEPSSSMTFNKYGNKLHSFSSSVINENEAKDNQVDMDLLKDVPAWFRSMRLHKYNSIFANMQWQDIVKLNDAELQLKGVAALGARRKMLKVFEGIKEYCRENNIQY